MRYSERWLRELVDPAIEISSLTSQMTMIGLKVDNIKHINNCFNGVVIGRIVKCYQHPMIDTLKINKVDIGRKDVLNIICNASNCRANIYVVVATVDTFISKYSRLKLIRINNEISDGMLCSLSELGLSKDINNKIIELPLDAPIGLNICDYWNLNDNIIDIDISPNRIDCFSLIGIAREIAIINNIVLKQSLINPILPNIDNTIPIYIDKPSNCPCYLGRIIKNINVNVFTPLWIKEKLLRSGIISVDIIVDLINYVYLELGQLIQIFDLNNIKDYIKVRFAYQNETFCLMNKTLILTSDTLVISDKHKILAMAGIVNNQKSITNLTTRDIFLECAFFDPQIINKCTKYYNLCTDNFYCHSYNVNIEPTLKKHAIEYITSLLVQVCGGEVAPIIDITSTLLLPKIKLINLRRDQLNKLIGHFISDDEIDSMLTSLGCKVFKINHDWQVSVPLWRSDLKIEEDLAEEIIRLYGYNNIPNASLYTHLKISSNNDSLSTLSRTKIMLSNQGYQEIVTYSFVNHTTQKILHPKYTPIFLLDPISKNMSVMRLSLWTGLLDTIIYNQNHQQQRINLFESGLCFYLDDKDKTKIHQNFVIAGAATGLRFGKHWNLKRRLVDFYDVKGNLEAIFEYNNILEHIEFRRKENVVMHPGQSAAIYFKNVIIGHIGSIHPLIQKKINLNSKVILFELFWEKIKINKASKIVNISIFPINYRDITIIIPAHIPVADIITECKKIKEDRLIDVNISDVYYGKNIKKGFKSVTINLSLQDMFCTLKEKEISEYISKYTNILEKKFEK